MSRSRERVTASEFRRVDRRAQSDWHYSLMLELLDRMCERGHVPEVGQERQLFLTMMRVERWLTKIGKAPP